MHGSILPVTTPPDTFPGRILQLSPNMVVYWLQVESNHTLLCSFLPQREKMKSLPPRPVWKNWENNHQKKFVYVTVIFFMLLNLTASYWNCTFCCLAACLDIAFQWFPMFDLKNILCSFIRLILFLRERLRLLST